MNQSIRDAAQALAFDARQAMIEYGSAYKNQDEEAIRSSTTRACAAIDALVSLATRSDATQPSADERVEEHMRLADDYYFCNGETNSVAGHRAAVEQSARALLSASQEDAEHAAMYRWLRDRGGRSWRIYPDGKPKQAIHATGEYYDDAVRAAMRDNP